jgi:hypothetical protein
MATVVIAAALIRRGVPELTADLTRPPGPILGSTPTGAETHPIPTDPPQTANGEGPAEGGFTDTELRAQVWSTIVSFYTNVRGCTDISSGGIRVTQQPDATGSWQETWEVSACGEGAELKIHFTVASDGGIFYDISE